MSHYQHVMKNILVINSTVRADESHSRNLTEHLLNHLQSQQEQTRVVRRELGDNAIPHYSADTSAGFYGETYEQAQAASELSFALIEEVKAADILIIGAPTYNFTIPSTLKAWIDHIARVGVTFRYTEEGPEGTLGGRKVYIAITSGGEASKYMEGQLEETFNMLGIDDITFIRAHTLDMPGGDAQLAAARADIDAL